MTKAASFWKKKCDITQKYVCRNNKTKVIDIEKDTQGWDVRTIYHL